MSDPNRSAPIPARPGRKADLPRQLGASEEAAGRDDNTGGDGRSLPTPVRQSFDARVAESPDAEVLEREFEADGVRWTARTVGSAVGAKGSGALLLLDVRFTQEDNGRSGRVLVAGSSLGALSEDALLRALATAVSG